MTPTDAKNLKERVIAILDDPETRARAEMYAQAHRRALANNPDMYRQFTI